MTRHVVVEPQATEKHLGGGGRERPLQTSPSLSDLLRTGEILTSLKSPDVKGQTCRSQSWCANSWNTKSLTLVGLSRSLQPAGEQVLEMRAGSGAARRM